MRTKIDECAESARLVGDEVTTEYVSEFMQDLGAEYPFAMRMVRLSQYIRLRRERPPRSVGIRMSSE